MMRKIKTESGIEADIKYETPEGYFLEFPDLTRKWMKKKELEPYTIENEQSED